jgi:hypothetical protein
MSARLFFVIATLMLLLTSREPPWADAHVVYDTTQSLVDRRALDVNTGGPTWFYAVRGGRKYGVFPLGNVVAMVPSYLAYKTLLHFDWLPERTIYATCAHLSPALLMAGACTIFFMLLRRRGPSVVTARWATAASLALAFGTICFIYGRSAYSEALQTFAMTWLVERTLAQAERPTPAGLGWLGAAAGVLVNSKLVYALVLPPVAIYLVWSRRRALADFFAKTPLALLAFGELLALALIHNHIKTGSYWQSGYTYPDGVFSGDLYVGLYGFFLSTGKGVFAYSPLLVLGVLGARTAWRRARAETALVASMIAIVVLFNAKFRVWHADYCWGPRHLTAVAPLGALLAFPWLPEALARGRIALRRAALVALVAGSLAVQVLGASFYWDHYIRILIAIKDDTGASGWFTEHLSHGHFIPEFSPIRGHAWLLSHAIRRDPELDHDAPWKPVLASPANLAEQWSRVRFDWWFLEWIDPPKGVPAAPVPGAVALALAIDLAALSADSFRRKLAPRERDRDRA